MSKSQSISLNTRTAGVLLHPTSLPGPFGCGDLGPAARSWIDQLSNSGVTWWQMLPTHPTSGAPGFSPYSSPSAFALSPLLISPEDLAGSGLLDRKDLVQARCPSSQKADFESATPAREKLLRTAFESFRTARGEVTDSYRRFISDEADWLEDWALFAAIRATVRRPGWIEWPKPLASRDANALKQFHAQHADLIEFQRFVQYIADQQWSALREYATARGVGLIGDVPIFVSHDSADVWANRKLFTLDASGKASFISGVPPDHFSKTGQKWGHPQYNWPVHKRTDFAWWTARFTRMLSLFDSVRIDHFLGFYRTWVIQGNAKDARKGKWKHTPGRDIFEALTSEVGGHPPIIAEDLGVESEGATELRQAFHIPGMKVLQFGFGEGHDHLPFCYTPHTVAYTGTHDNETSLEFYQRVYRSNASEKPKLLALGITPDEPVWRMIEMVACSVANTVIVPAQDLLQLDGKHRMNTPGTVKGNWRWRLDKPIPSKVMERFAGLLQATGRASASLVSSETKSKAIKQPRR